MELMQTREATALRVKILVRFFRTSVMQHLRVERTVEEVLEERKRNEWSQVP